jgi:hypothetical protein
VSFFEETIEIAIDWKVGALVEEKLTAHVLTNLFG